MDDLSTFEVRLAAGLAAIAGPPRSVDGQAIARLVSVAATASRPRIGARPLPRWWPPGAIRFAGGVAVLVVAAIAFAFYFSRPPVVPSGTASPAPSSVPSVTPTLRAVVPTPQSPTTVPSATSTPYARSTPLLPPTSAAGSSEVPHLDLDIASGIWRERDVSMYAYVVRNPNEALSPATAVQIYLNFFDESGLIRSERSRVLPGSLVPGKPGAAVIGTVGLPPATRIEVVADAHDWQEGVSITLSFEFDRVRTTQEIDGRYRTVGLMRGSNGLGAPGVHIFAIYFNDGGGVIAGQEITVTHCGCGLTEFEIVSPIPLPEFASVEIFWSWPVAGL